MEIKENIKNILIWLLFIISIIIIISLIIFDIYLWINYGNKPIDEIPLWVLYFLWGHR